MVSQCGAGAWLNGLASGDQPRLMGSGSASEACSQRYAIQIDRYFILLNFHINLSLQNVIHPLWPKT